MEERLQKLMARANVGSRRTSETIIAEGRVRVNGRVAALGDKADPAVDRIEVDGRPLIVEEEHSRGEEAIYIALHKPRGVLSSLEDELGEERTTVRDLIPIDSTRHIYPVGRLDKPSEGLVLMTNDGALAHRLTHPRFGHEKVYYVIVEGNIAESTLERWRRGVMLDGRITAPAPIEVVERRRDETDLRIILREGRKRQIRRIAAALGHPVRRLIRERIGPLNLGELGPGEWRFLTEQEIALLKRSLDEQPAGRGPAGRGKEMRLSTGPRRKKEHRAAGSST